MVAVQGLWSAAACWLEGPVNQIDKNTLVTALPPMDPEDGRYNARDVLGMCRVYPFLQQSLVHVGTTEVYKADRELARIALQMHKVGMPVDLEERKRVRTVLEDLAKAAEAKLLVYTQGEHYDTFLDWVCRFQGKNARKDDPQGGQTNIRTNLPHSDESAFLARVDIRKAELREKLNKAALQEAIYAWVKHGHEEGTPYNDWTLAQGLGVEDRQHVSRILRSWGTKGVLKVEKTVQGKGKEKRTIYTAWMPKIPKTVEAQEAYRELIDETVKGISMGAKIQQAAVLRTAGVPLIKTTEKQGLPKIDKEVLEELGHHEASRDMLQFILTDKAVSFIDGIDIAPSPFEGYGTIHADWSIHKITGRFGSSPNVQNRSKRAGGGVENIRKMIAAYPGYIICGGDYDQVEARLLGAQSQDPFLLGIFNSGKDIHTEFGKLAFPSIFPKLAEIYAQHQAHLKATGQVCGPDASDPKSVCDMCTRRDKLRDLTKRLEYGGLYKGEADTLWQSIVKDEPDLKRETVVQFLMEVNRACTGLRKWQDEMLLQVLKDKVIRSPILGRCQFFPMGRVDPTVAANYPNQAGGADLWSIGARKFAAQYDQYAPIEVGPRMFHNGHDSVSVLCKEERGEEVCNAIEASWGCRWNNVNFTIKATAAHRWSAT